MGGSQSSSSHSRKRQKPKPVIDRVKTNNVREEIEKSIKNNQLKKLYTVGGGPDPAKNCDKAFSSSYKCFPNGESRSVNYPADATGRTYEYNCTDEYNQCTGSKLILDDDGNLVSDIEKSDIVLVGVSRTSKTPTSIYLANRGFKTSNIPLVNENSIPIKLRENPQSTCVVGLSTEPERLVEIRKNRMNSLKESENTKYTSIENIKKEIEEAKKTFQKYRWPSIDVTRKSVEETAASIIKIHEIYLNNVK